MLKLKLQYFGHLMWRVDSLEKTLMLGGMGGRRRKGHREWDGWMVSQTWWTWVWVNSGSWWWTGRPGVLQFMGLQRVRHDWATELNWTVLIFSFNSLETVSFSNLNICLRAGLKPKSNTCAAFKTLSIDCFPLPHILEKAMAPYSSTLAWKIPWMEEPGRLQSMGLLRVRYDWATSLSLFTFMHWRRKW